MAIISRKAAKSVRDAVRPRARKTEPTVEDKWRTYGRALIITAHPDDAEFMAGGTIAKMCAMGMDVTLCVMTSGDKGTRDVTIRRQELAATREQETRAAAAALGVKRCIFWGMPDGYLEESIELRGMVVKLIRTLKPDIVLTWDGFRAGFNHNDHRVVGRVVRDALYPAAHDPHYHEELTRAGIGPHRTAELLMAGAEEPDYHVDIGPYLETKAAAVAAHASQVDNRPAEEFLKAWREGAKRNPDRRKRTGYDFAESFRRVEFRRPPGAPGTPPARKATTKSARPASRRTAARAR